MITLRKRHERGHANHGWLDSRHTFSFAGYYDPKHMGVSDLRVINEDRVVPGAGFPSHSHKDMEIISYVLAGALEHRDSMGNSSVIRPGDVQRMSAGSGVTHSEYNGSRTEPVHFLQIWIQPDQLGLAPGYEQARFPDEAKRNQLRLVASADGREGSVTVHQDTRVYVSLLEAGNSVTHAPTPGRTVYLHLTEGEVSVNGLPLQAGDGATVRGEPGIELTTAGGGEALLFDLAGESG